MASSPRCCWSRARAKLDRYPRGLALGGCALFATLACALAAPPLTPAAPTTPSISGPICLASGNGFLRARLNGDIDKNIDWANAGTECQGMPRPDGRGLRLSFARAVEPGGHRLVIVFGVANIGENQSGKALPVNVTLIVEGATRIYGTRGDDKCLVDRLRSQPLVGQPLVDHSHSRVYRIEAHGFCTQPARAVLGSGAVLISTFDFAGQVSFEEPKQDPFADFPRMSVTLESAAGTHTITAWIADTSARRAQGLMFVRSLAPKAGMLFVFADAQYVSMWMKNTYVALDMLFIDPAGHIVNIAENAQPLSLATINSAAPVSAVLELPAGTVKRFDLHAGDRVRYARSGT